MTENVQAKAEEGSERKRDLAKVRLQKIRQYLSQSLEDTDPLRANLGAVTSDLMGLGFRLKQGIEKALAESPDLLTRFTKITPTIEIYLKTMRQVDRFVQLDRRLTATKEIGIARKPR